MTDTNYKLLVNNIHLTDPETIDTPPDTAGSNQYKFTMGTKIHTKKEYNITKTIYHSKVNLQLDTNITTTKIVPFWELASSSSNTNITIGRIVLNITFNTIANNSTKPKMLRLVGSIPANSDIDSSLTKTSDTNLESNILGTNASIYKSNFYIKGRNVTSTGTTFKHIIDLNKGFNSLDKTIYALGLEVNEVPAAKTKIILDSYIELLS